MANAGRSKIEMVEGMKVLHVDMFEASRGPAHKPGPGGLVLGKEQLEKIVSPGPCRLVSAFPSRHPHSQFQGTCRPAPAAVNTHSTAKS